MHRSLSCRTSRRTLVALVALGLAGRATRSAAQVATPTVPPAAGAPVELVWEIKGGPEPFASPICVAVDPIGILSVTDGDANNVKVFDLDGNYLRTIGERGEGDGQFVFDGHSVTAAVDAAGNLYVGDHKVPRVQKFDREGRFLLSWGSFGTGDGQFINPWGLGVGPDGNILVNDDQRGDAQWFDPNGTFLGKWGVFKGDGRFSPGPISVDGQGHIWAGAFDTSDNNTVSVVEFDEQGVFLRTVGSPGDGDGQYQLPLAIGVDAAGYIYVGDPVLGRVQIFDPEGNHFAHVIGSGADGDRVREPSHIAVSGDGHLYVVDVLGDRVLKFRLLPPLGVA